jgi:hypothetical protein
MERDGTDCLTAKYAEVAEILDMEAENGLSSRLSAIISLPQRRANRAIIALVLCHSSKSGLALSRRR